MNMTDNVIPSTKSAKTIKVTHARTTNHRRPFGACPAGAGAGGGAGAGAADAGWP